MGSGVGSLRMEAGTSGLGESHYFLLGAPSAGRIARGTAMPTVIAEPLYLTNPADVAIARSGGFTDTLAGAFAAAASRGQGSSPARERWRARAGSSRS